MSCIKIALIDDEEDHLNLSIKFLQQENDRFIISTYSDPVRALKEVLLNSFQVVICDYKMPEMNGIELLKKIRQSNLRLPFIMFTGKGREEVVIDFLDSGGNRYIKKGSDIQAQYKLLATIIQDEVQKWKTETALRSRDYFFYQILHDLDEGVQIIEEGEKTYINDKAVEIFGYTKDELRHLNCLDLAVPEEKETLKRYMEDAKTLEKMFMRIKFWAQTKTGERRYIYSRIYVAVKEGKLEHHYIISKIINEES